MNYFKNDIFEVLPDVCPDFDKKSTMLGVTADTFKTITKKVVYDPNMSNEQKNIYVKTAEYLSRKLAEDKLKINYKKFEEMCAWSSTEVFNYFKNIYDSNPVLFANNNKEK